MIADLNIEAVFTVYPNAQTANGTPTKGTPTTYTDWVGVEQRSGSRTLEQAGVTFDKAYNITKRHWPERPVVARNTTVTHDGEELTIHDVRMQQEGRRWYEILICYAHKG